MQITTFYPTHPLLQQHIAYYYFFKSTTKSFSKSYYAFPHTYQSLNIHRNAVCAIGNNQVSVTGSEKKGFLSIVQGRYAQPLLVQLNGALDKVTIVLKPLGLNHFIQQPFNTLAGQHSQEFHDWQSDSGYTDFLQQFFQTENNEQRVQKLEAYLLSLYHTCSFYTVLFEAVKQLGNFDAELSIAETAANCGLHTRSFTRLFHRELGISPAGYKKIARFRHSLQNKLYNRRFKRLTEIGYASNFYDQAYFIKIYKKLTSVTPAAFFRSIDSLADDQLILKFIQQ